MTRTLAGLVLAGTAVALAGCGSVPAGPGTSAGSTPPGATSPAFHPRVLLRLSGSGDETSRPFTVPGGGNYKIRWTYSEGSFPGHVNFIVSDPGMTADVNELGSGGHGNSYVYGAPRRDHLSITSEGTWTVKVVSAP